MPTLPDHTDVLVVGAGPAGLVASVALTRRGVDHVIVDRAPLGANTSRAAVVHARTLEVLDELGVAGDLLERGVVVPTFTVRDRDRTLVTLDFGGLPTRFPYTLMVPQNITERVLADHLSGLGRAPVGGWSFEGFAPLPDGSVRVALARSDGSRHEIVARHVVGADGMHSAVRDAAGIDFVGAAYAQSFVLADVRLDWRLPRDEVQLFFGRTGLVVVAPLPGGHHRVVATLDTAPEHPDADDIAAILTERGPTRHRAAVHEVAWSSRFRVHHRLATAYRSGPVFLVGDAAHVHSPAGGQGMNTGIQDAAMLGELLAGVLVDGTDPVSLEDYETVRRPVAREVVRLTDRMTRAATLSGPAAALRNTALTIAGRVPAVRRYVAMNLSELSTRPDAPNEAPVPARRPTRR